MGHTIHEQQGVARFQFDFNSSFHPLQGSALLKSRSIKRRMNQVGLVAAGNDHGGPIPGADVIESQNDVDLTAAELIVVKSILGIDASLVGSGVQTRRHTRSKDGGTRTFQDRPIPGPDGIRIDPFGDGRILTADVSLQMLGPGRMIDKSQKGAICFHHLIEES